MKLREYLEASRFNLLFTIQHHTGACMLSWYAEHRPELLDREVTLKELSLWDSNEVRPFLPKAEVCLDGIDGAIALIRDDEYDNHPFCRHFLSGDHENERRYLRDLDLVRELARKVFDDPADIETWLDEAMDETGFSPRWMLKRGKTDQVIGYLQQSLGESDKSTGN